MSIVNEFVTVYVFLKGIVDVVMEIVKFDKKFDLFIKLIEVFVKKM